LPTRAISKPEISLNIQPHSKLNPRAFRIIFWHAAGMIPITTAVSINAAKMAIAALSI